MCPQSLLSARIALAVCLLRAMSVTSSCTAVQQEQSFKEFVQRPEHRALLEQHQKEEVSAVLQLREQLQELQLQQEVGHDQAGCSRAWLYCCHWCPVCHLKVADTTANCRM